ncbi:MAG: lytic transglycosylase domain-containing protein [Oleiphilaceae bacterium]|nr:lytic transglycosylase domain-containing protein [Oleiphilaceae bacterium]
MNIKLAASILLSLLPLASITPVLSAPGGGYTEIIRAAPYWVSQDTYNNIVTIRRWVLSESGYCSRPERHVLFGLRGEFLGYIDDGDSRAETQKRLNETRAKLADRGTVDAWVTGNAGTTGYPFALACDQPHVNLNDAIARYLGTRPQDLIWGTWDDLSLGSKDDPRSLHNALIQVYQTRQEQKRLDLPAELPRYLAGQLLIESGARPAAHSIAGARGILQLLPAALGDCGVAEANHWHRMAQIDCALKLMNQNARNLRPLFDERFGKLPEAKRDRLFTLLLIQAYHGGAGRVQTLLADDTLARPAQYFAEHHERFSAGDIAFGLIFHNLGRDRFGLASLYYVADVQLATEALCQTPQLEATGFCQ